MNLSLGSILNSSANIMSKLGNGDDSDAVTLQKFLDTVDQYGIQIKSNYEVEFSAFQNITFYIQSMTTPQITSHMGELWFKGRKIKVPVNYEHDHDFTMTVINDSTGFLYTEFRKIMISDFNFRLLKNPYTMKIHVKGDQGKADGSDVGNTAGMEIHMEGVRLESIGGLDFGSQEGTVQTFNINCSLTRIRFETSKVVKEEGLLGKVDKISNTIGNVLGM